MGRFCGDSCWRGRRLLRARSKRHKRHSTTLPSTLREARRNIFASASTSPEPGSWPQTRTTTPAIQLLTEAAETARSLGFKGFELEGLLLLGAVELESGLSTQGRALGSSASAARRGNTAMGLIAEQASSILAGGSL